MHAPTSSSTPCLCGSGLEYQQCCAPLHSGEKSALSAEQLMRSRFTAYALRNKEYLLSSWDAATRPEKIDFAQDDVDWRRLEIVSSKKGGPRDNRGVVEFKAYYQLDGEQHVMREISRFKKTAGHWYYLDGQVKSIARAGERTNLGKNAPCPCGSGKKYKRCCYKSAA